MPVAAMNEIVQKLELAPKIYEMVVQAPRIAKKAQPGQFVVVMADERGERIPLTIADFDRAAGTITLVLMVVGTSSLKLSRMAVGRCPVRPDRAAWATPRKSRTSAR